MEGYIIKPQSQTSSPSAISKRFFLNSFGLPAESLFFDYRKDYKKQFLNVYMNVKRGLYIIGSTLFLIGIILVINSLQTITGFTIIEDISITISRSLGLFFLLIGIILFVTGSNWDRYRVGLVLREYELGSLNPIQAALKINDRLFPSGIKITGVDYRGGTNETIRTEKEYIPVKLHNDDKARDLALALYEIAVINNRENAKNCELHLSKKASSKHHKAGLLKIIEKFEEKYKEDLETARAA